MIKSIISAGALLIGYACFSQTQGNYIVIINNDSIQIDLNNDTVYTTNSGEELTLKITQPDVLTYSDDMISFDHHKSLTVSNTKIEEGIETMYDSEIYW